MEKLKTNKYLLLSLKQDLTELNKLNKQIQLISRLKVDSSWLSDTAPKREISSTGNAYLFCLEYIIDKLYTLLVGFNNYLVKNNTMLNSDRRMIQNMNAPDHFTLGRIAEMVWQNILHVANEQQKAKHSHLQQQRNNNQSNKLSPSSSSTQMQTDISSLVLCDSCYIAKSCLKKLAEDVEDAIYKSCVSQIKKEIRLNVFDITQVGCMNQLTNAIEKDFKHVIAQNEELDILKTAHEIEIDDLKYKYNESQTKLLTLEENCSELKDVIKKEKEENATISTRLSQVLLAIDEQETNCNEHQITNFNLQKDLSALKNLVAKLKQENLKLEEDMKSINIERVQLNAERNEWKAKFDAINVESQQLARKYKSLSGQIDELRVQMQENKVAVPIDIITKKYYKNIEEKQFEFERVLHEIKTCVMNFLNIEESRRKEFRQALIAPSLIQDAKVKGDPYYDITAQFEVNTRNIKSLEQQNKRLFKILSKLQLENNGLRQ